MAEKHADLSDTYVLVRVVNGYALDIDLFNHHERWKVEQMAARWRKLKPQAVFRIDRLIRERGIPIGPEV